MKGLLLALGFLTAIPMPPPDTPSADCRQALGRAGVWFPAVGLTLGLVLAAAHFVSSRFFPPLLSAALVVALWAALTGGLHLDGLADCCDGLLITAPSERRLEIMRDPRLGAFGGAGLALFLCLKILAVASLPPSSSGLPSFAFLLAPALARWLLLPAARQPSARPGGLGAEFAAGLTRPVLMLALAGPLALILLGGWRALAAAACGHVVAFGLARLARARLGGVTGDVLGLIVELAELTVLLAYAIQVRP